MAQSPILDAPAGRLFKVFCCDKITLMLGLFPQNLDTESCRSARKKFSLRWAWILLVLAAGLTVARPMVAQGGKPLSANDVMELLQGGVPSGEIARVVAENGIDFHMSDELEKKFRDAGATDVLVDALRKASKPVEPPQPAERTGILKVQSQPGEAQVYVNDEPRGMTSAEGALRLPGLPAGTYRVRVSLQGYKSWEHTITIAAGETETAFVILEKEDLAPAVTLVADRNSIQRGQSVMLTWSSLNASAVDIEPLVGKVALTGSTSVAPRQSTTYTLTAIGPGGSKTATAFVAVTVPASPRVPAPAGNLPGFPVPGASFKEIKFFESGYTPPQLASRVYELQFNHRTTRFIYWEFHITCPPVASRTNFTINATWYYPTGEVFNQPVQTSADAGWTEPAFYSRRGWPKAGNWKRGAYQVVFFVNGNRIAGGSFSVY
jgi:hypothetical protein